MSLEMKYRQRYIQEGNTPKGFFWNDCETQELRYSQILQMIHKDEKHSVHDVGCGTGGFFNYATDKGYKWDYSGCEVVPEMVRDFRETVSNARVLEGKFLDINYSEKFDFIVLSGLFNMPDDNVSWNNFIEKTILKMWSLANKGVVFNCLTQYSTFTDEQLAYLNPGDLLNFCQKNCSRFVKIDHGYPLFEFTFGVYRPQFIQSQFNNPAFAKYFGKNE